MIDKIDYRASEWAAIGEMVEKIDYRASQVAAVDGDGRKNRLSRVRMGGNRRDGRKFDYRASEWAERRGR